MLLEALPDRVVATLEARDAWRRKLAKSGVGMQFIVSDLKRWKPGATVRIAFLDGDTSLHAGIEQATRQITDVANLKFDFGRDASTGEYRRWTESDTVLAAEIRVSFDQPGYWSLVGTDSIDPAIGGQGSTDGGAAAQRSLNLGGFKEMRPADWEGTVRHEFLHALSFHHAHQNMRGRCEQEFRWEDDPGYQPTQDQSESFVVDPQGRSPGIYTYLSGAPNFWPREKVDFNLRTNVADDVVTGPFDPASVMLYQFEPLFYKTDPSPCAPTGNGIDLSEGDKRGLELLYPHVEAEIAAIKQQAAAANRQFDASMSEEFALAPSAYQQRVSELLVEWQA